MSGTEGAPPPSIGGRRFTVLAIVADAPTRALLPKVVHEHLLLTDDPAEVPLVAARNEPEVAFVEIGMNEGAGLALVHHLKAVAPDVTVYALASRSALETAANAVALGGAGLIMMPVSGDEIRSAISSVKLALADRAKRAEVERAAKAYAKLRGVLGRVAALASCASRTAAAEQLVELLIEATGAQGAVVYLVAGPGELSRAATSPTLDGAPPLGMEPDVKGYAAREQLLSVPLSAGSLTAGLVLLSRSPRTVRDTGVTHGLAPDAEETLALVASQATPALSLLAERERQAAATIKDPASSAYSFAYYVDVAGREIDKARRYGRRFAIATVAFEASDEGERPPMGHAEMADMLLRAARDTDVLAQVDEHEFHLLMPETDGLGAHAARRRVIARLIERGGKVMPRGLAVGVSTFPHDGANLSQLLRVARRRAEATRHSLVRRIASDQTGLADILDAFGWEARGAPAPRHLRRPSPGSAARRRSRARGGGGRRRPPRRRHPARRGAPREPRTGRRRPRRARPRARERHAARGRRARRGLRRHDRGARRPRRARRLRPDRPARGRARPRAPRGGPAAGRPAGGPARPGRRSPALDLGR